MIVPRFPRLSTVVDKSLPVAVRHQFSTTSPEMLAIYSAAFALAARASTSIGDRPLANVHRGSYADHAAQFPEFYPEVA